MQIEATYSRCRSLLLCKAWGGAWLAVSVAGCASPRQPSPSAPPPVVEPAGEPATLDRVIELEDGTYVEIVPGLETGFAHCCGDEHYMMEVECSEGLLRCYTSETGRWKQTYGKHCKHSLDSECYEKTCP